MLCENSEGKRNFGTSRGRCEESIEVDHNKDIMWVVYYLRVSSWEYESTEFYVLFTVHSCVIS